MQPQPSGGDQGQTAKALYDHQAGKYGDKNLKIQHQELKYFLKTEKPGNVLGDGECTFGLWHR